MVERHFDVVDVRGSTPLSPTRDKNTPKGVFLLSLVRAIEESKDGGRKAVLRLRRAWPSRGREHLGFCERSEVKDLVIRDRISNLYIKYMAM